MASLSPTRIAAFEFLIQFRSAGRNQIRNAVRDLRRISIASRDAGRQTNRMSRSQTAFANAIRVTRNNVTAGVAAQNRYNAALARERGLLAAVRRGQARRNVSQSISRADSSGFTRGVTRLFGFRAGARASQGLASASRGVSALRAGFSRLAGPIGVVISLFKGLVGAARIYLGTIVQLVKFNAVFLGGLTVAAVLLARVADGYTNLTNRIRVASDGTKSITQQTAELTQVALRSRTAFSNVAELYGRISLNAKSFGKSQAEVLKFTELTAKAVKVGGSTDREASQALIQFSQGIGSNRLSGDELRAVREQTPFLADQIARGLGKTIGDLKVLGEAGKLTTDVVFEALLNRERAINIAFGRVEATFSDSLTNIRSTIGVFAGATLSNLKFGPRFFEFTNKISEGFARISEKAPELALAIRNIPTLFRSFFGRANGLDGFFKLLQKIGDFFVDLPENILKAARSINRFAQNIQNGVSLDESSKRAFGKTADALKKDLSPFNGVFQGFLDQFEILNANLKLIADAMATVAGAYNGIRNLPGVASDFALSGGNFTQFYQRRAIRTARDNAGNNGEL